MFKTWAFLALHSSLNNHVYLRVEFQHAKLTLQIFLSAHPINKENSPAAVWERDATESSQHPHQQKLHTKYPSSCQTYAKEK